MENYSTNLGGIGILIVIGIFFIILKLVDTIDWSWWLVLLPFYGLALIFLLIVLLLIIFDYFFKSS